MGFSRSALSGKTMEFDNTETIKRAVEINAGVALLPSATLQAEIKAGTIKGLAVCSEQRWPDLPEVPTMLEQGYKDFVFDTYTALMAPAKTPHEVVARLEKVALDEPWWGPSLDHAVWFHAPLRGDEWMLLELWPLKASSSRGVYSGSLRSEDGRLGVLLTQEMLLRDRKLDPAMLRRIAEYLGVTPEDVARVGPRLMRFFCACDDRRDTDEGIARLKGRIGKGFEGRRPWPPFWRPRLKFAPSIFELAPSSSRMKSAQTLRSCCWEQ